ncbi:hypothetical protein OIV83_004620 [Microbotryomycetes sp. JL201]|nr:hypothetical protein OIV83_004620 [Microbotryomycetes sp. JL201]
MAPSGRIRLGGQGAQHILHPFRETIALAWHRQTPLVRVIVKSYPVDGVPLRVRPAFIILCALTLVLLGALGFHPTLANKLTPPKVPLWDKVLHFVGFTLASSLFYAIWLVEHNARRTGGPQWRYFNEILSSVVCGLFGSIGSEFVQSLLPYKTFQWGDVIANLLGTVLGIWFARRVTLNSRRAAELRRLYQPLDINDNSLETTGAYRDLGLDDDDEHGDEREDASPSLTRMEQGRRRTEAQIAGVGANVASSRRTARIEENVWDDADDDPIFDIGGADEGQESPTRTDPSIVAPVRTVKRRSSRASIDESAQGPPPRAPSANTSPALSFVDLHAPPPSYASSSYTAPFSPPRSHSVPHLPNLSFTSTALPSVASRSTLASSSLPFRQSQPSHQPSYSQTFEYASRQFPPALQSQWPTEHELRPRIHSRSSSSSLPLAVASTLGQADLPPDVAAWDDFESPTGEPNTTTQREASGLDADDTPLEIRRRRRNPQGIVPLEPISPPILTTSNVYRRSTTGSEHKMARSRTSTRDAEDGHPSAPSLPTTATATKPSNSAFPRSKRSSAILFLLQSLSVMPSLLGFAYAAFRFHSPSTLLLDTSKTWTDGGKAVGVAQARSTKLDWFIAGMWALACAYFSHQLAKGLLRRWLVYYSRLPTIIRALSLQAICWPLTLTTHRFFSWDQPVAAWFVCATTAAFSNVIQIWVTSNIVEKKDRKGHQQYPFISNFLSVVVGPGVRTEKYRKGERALSWKRVVWGTVAPFALLGWITTILLLWQQFSARYHGGGGVSLGGPKLDTIVGVGGINGLSLTDLDREANVRVVILVTSSWTNRSMSNRRAFRESSVLLIPQSTKSISITYRFLLGSAPSPQTASKMGPEIQKETDEFHDMLIVPAHDGYADLSRKIYEGWKWAGQLDVDYVLKTDDDILLRMDVLSKEFVALGRRREYWRGFAYWEIPAIKDASNKNADFAYELSSFPPYTAGALHILSRDLVSLIAPPDASRLFVMNEDQNLGLWLYPTGIRPIHDHRIQQAQVCENDMIAKHFGGQYKEPNGFGMRDMYENIVSGRKPCQGALQKWCGVCYPSCRSRDNHWRDWGFACDEIKGATLSSKPSSHQATLEAPVKTPPSPFVIGSADDPWVVPGLLSRHTSTFSQTDDWHLLHMMCWTTSQDTFQERHYQALESIWAHEPRAIIFMMSTTLPLDFFKDYTKHGFAVHVVRIGGPELLYNGWYLGPNSQRWLTEWDQWSKGQFFYSHLTDYLRYLFLFKFGGTYLDMDAPWVRAPPDSNLEFIGADQSTYGPDLDWTLDEDGTYLAPGVMRFRKGWTLFKDIMEQAFSSTYKPDCFNCVGPRAITTGVKQRRRQLELNGFTIVPSHVLYPKNWITSHELVKSMTNGRQHALDELKQIVETSWSIHLFGKMTNHLRIQPDSVVGEAFNEFSLNVYRRVGSLSTSDRELGKPKLASGLEIRGPIGGVYVFKSKIKAIQREVGQVDLRGGFDGVFEGLDVLFARSAKEAYVDSAHLQVSTKLVAVEKQLDTISRDPRFDECNVRVSMSSSSSSSAKLMGTSDLAAMDVDSRTATLTGATLWSVDMTNPTLKDVNVLLNSLRIVKPPDISLVKCRQFIEQNRLQHLLDIQLKFGREHAGLNIKLDVDDNLT